MKFIDGFDSQRFCGKHWQTQASHFYLAMICTCIMLHAFFHPLGFDRFTYLKNSWQSSCSSGLVIQDKDWSELNTIRNHQAWLEPPSTVKSVGNVLTCPNLRAPKVMSFARLWIRKGFPAMMEHELNTWKQQVSSSNFWFTACAAIRDFHHTTERVDFIPRTICCMYFRWPRRCFPWWMENTL